MLDFIKRNKPAAVHEHNFAPKAEGAAVAKVVDLSTYQRVINFCLYGLVLLVPILFLPLTSEVRDFNKQALIFLAVVVMLGVWVVKILTTRKVSWVKTSLDYILLAYLAVYLVASLVSIDKPSSFLGYYGRFSGSFISVLSLVILYFLVVNNVRTERAVHKITKFYLWGSGIVLVYSFLQLLGLYALPMAFTHDRSFNPIGSLVGIGLYAAFSIVFLQWMLFVEPNRSKLKTISLWTLSIVALVILFMVNAFIAWLVLALGLVAFLALSMSIGGEQTSPSWFWKPMLMLVIAVLFVAFNFLPGQLNPRNILPNNLLPVEIQLSNSTTWHLVANSMKMGAKSAILGSGPGTTGLVYGQLKPTNLNQTIVWSLNFDRASSEIANIAIETGILGLAAFEITAILFLIYGWFFLTKNMTHEGWKYAFGFFALWLTLYVTHFFYFFNMTFYFMYWFSIAMFMAVTHLRQKEEEQSSMSFSDSPRSALSWMFASLIILAVLLVGVFFEVAVYGGDVAYANGLKQLNQAKPDLVKSSNDFARAVTLNQYRDVYLLAYGQNLIFQAQEESAKAKPDVNVIQNYMATLINVGQQAVALSPARSSNWQALSQFYQTVKPLAPGADQFIIDNLQKAIDRDPNNPSLHFQLGLANFAAAQGKDDKGNVKIDEKLAAASEKELNKVIELKPDLPDPYIQLARQLEAQNKVEDAKKKMDETVKLFPYNADILFEAGRLTFNLKKTDEAEQLFLNVIAVNPNYANAHYSLGLIYQGRGDKEKALAEFQKAKDIVGQNADLDKLIEALKAQVPAKK